MDGSTVGIRAVWSCAACRRTAITRQFYKIHGDDLALPPHWRLIGDRVFCPDHLVVVDPGRKEETGT